MKVAPRGCLRACFACRNSSSSSFPSFFHLLPKATLMRSDYHLNQKISGPRSQTFRFSPGFASRPFVGFAVCSCTLRPCVLFERWNARLMFYSLLLFGCSTSGRLGRGTFTTSMAEIKEKNVLRCCNSNVYIHIYIYAHIHILYMYCKTLHYPYPM